MILFNPLFFIYIIVALFFFIILLDSAQVKIPQITQFTGLLLVMMGILSPILIAKSNDVFFQKQQEEICSYLKLDLDQCQLNYSAGLFHTFDLELVVNKKIEGSCLIERFNLKNNKFELHKNTEKCNKYLVLSLLKQDYKSHIQLIDAEEIENNLNKNKEVLKSKVSEFINDDGGKT